MKRSKLSFLVPAIFAACGLTAGITSYAASEQSNRCGNQGQVTCSCVYDPWSGQTICTHAFIVV